jgi:hypothetical protein
VRVRAAAAPALALVLSTLAPAPVPAAEPAPLEDARRAAERTAFDGVLELRWRDGTDTRSEHLTVEAAGGALMVRGTNSVMAGPAFGRLLAYAGGRWEEMWLPSLAPGPRPDGGGKYVTSAPAPGRAVAGRLTTVLEVRRGDALVERVYLDNDTNLVLERDQYDAEGLVVRTLAFESLTYRPASAPPAEPRSPAHHAPKETSVGSSAPSLAEGYRRLGTYRRGPVVQVLYSDGLYDLSLFEQAGRLRRADVPASGERVAVGNATGWRYPWPGGQLVMWSAGGNVYTAVSDAPADQVLTAVRSWPATGSGELSLMGKLRRATQTLMEPLS